MALNSFPGASIPSLLNLSELQQLATIVNNLLQGKVNVAVEFTPADSTTSTLVEDVRISPNSLLIIEATSPTGATQLAGGGMFIDASDRGAGECTVTHTTGAAGELFRLLILS